MTVRSAPEPRAALPRQPTSPRRGGPAWRFRLASTECVFRDATSRGAAGPSVGHPPSRSAAASTAAWHVRDHPTNRHPDGRRMTKRRSAITMTLAIVIAWPASASADESSRAIYDQCQTGKITGNYTQKQYREALRNIQTDLAEYTDCSDVIRRAQLAAAAGRTRTSPTARALGPGHNAPSPATPPSVASAASGDTAAQLLARATPGERTALRAMKKRDDGPVLIGGIALTPNSSSPPGGAANRIPPPLAVALALGGIGLVGAVGRSLTSRRRKAA